MATDLKTRADAGRRGSADPGTRVAVATDHEAPFERADPCRSAADLLDVRNGSLQGLVQGLFAPRLPGPAPIIAAGGDLEIDLGARRVRSHGGEVVLTTREFDLLAFLATHPGLVFSREDLLRAVWHSDPDWQQIATVTEHVRRLRSKIERDPRAPALLQTVRGVGYRFDLPADGRGPSEWIERAPGSLIEIDGHIVSADEGAAALFGFACASDLIGRDLVDLVAQSWGAAFRARRKMIVDGGSPRSQLLAVTAADGSEQLVEMTSSTTQWLGQPARKKVLVPARTDAEALRHLATGVFSDVTDAVIVTDASFHIRSWNEPAHAMYGWSEDEVIGRHVSDAIPWADDASERCGELHNVGRWHGEGYHVTREGTEIGVTASTTRVDDERGRTVALVTVNRHRGPGAPSPLASDHAAITETDIRRGLAAGEFVVRYEPIVRLPDGQLLTAQAVLHWDHPHDGLLVPRQFIDAVRSDVLRMELSQTVLDEACRSAHSWTAAGMDVGVAVKLTGEALCAGGVADRIGDLLVRSHLEPARLWIEVAERSVVANIEVAQHEFRRLRELGIGITIDRFGSGSASLVYLRDVAFDAIKIDSELIAGVANHASDRAVVRSMVALGAELGVFVVADGVESRAQARTLAAIGCSIGQGDLYGRAVPAELLQHADSRGAGSM